MLLFFGWLVQCLHFTFSTFPNYITAHLHKDKVFSALSDCWTGQHVGRNWQLSFTFMHLTFESVSRNSCERSFTVQGYDWDNSGTVPYRRASNPHRACKAVMLLIGRDTLAVSCLTGFVWPGCHVQRSRHRARIRAIVTHAQASLHHVSPLVSPLSRQVVKAVLLPVTDSETQSAFESMHECVYGSQLLCNCCVYLEIK